jgi:hypothetical protein
MLWVVTPCRSERTQRFGVKCRLLLRQAQLSASFCWFHAWLTSNPDYGGDMFPQNDRLTPKYKLQVAAVRT